MAVIFVLIFSPHGLQDQDPAYMEPSRVRPRFDYSGSGRGTHFRGTNFC